jgi:ABC-2 type transport system ATP-binding protein
MSFKLENISKSFGNVQALQDVSFETAKSEIFGLIGPDGAGKTSLFRILVTLLLADKGRASVSGLDVVKDYREIRKHLGYMAGRFSLYQDLSVKENMQFYATVFGTTILENYDLVKDIYSHIEPFEDRLAGRLSGGMKQKLALSCALIHRPEVLILDEPTTGVDAVSRKEFWEMLKNIQKEGITILVSTPYMDEAAMCDRVGLLQKGRLLSVCKPDELELENGAKLYHFSTRSKIYDYLKRIREIDLSIAAWLFGDEIHLILKDARELGMLKETFSKWDAEDFSFYEAPLTVEDYFMQLMTQDEVGLEQKIS